MWTMLFEDHTVWNANTGGFSYLDSTLLALRTSSPRSSDQSAYLSILKRYTVTYFWWLLLDTMLGIMVKTGQ